MTEPYKFPVKVYHSAIHDAYIQTCPDCGQDIRTPEPGPIRVCDNCSVVKKEWKKDKKVTADIDRVLALREGGQTKRCHTHPALTHYDVAQHCYNMVALLMVLHPKPSMELVTEIMTHDLAERWTGDLPAPVKWRERAFANEAALVEDAVLKNLGYNNQELLSEGDRAWLKALDSLELWLWAQHELYLGNQYMRGMIERLDLYFSTRSDIPEPVAAFRLAYRHKRLEEDHYARNS
jgi:hypothetical protein